MNVDKVRYDVHPQNPLQAKVSQVILNALSSFDRKHLNTAVTLD